MSNDRIAELVSSFGLVGVKASQCDEVSTTSR